MRCTILQPTYLPWAGYFEMIAHTENFVIYDHVQFVRKSWQQRNKIKSANGITVLSVPVQHEKQDTSIKDIRISYDNGNALEKHWKSIEVSYKKARYFKQYEEIFRKIYAEKFTFLKDLNSALIVAICDVLGIKTNIIYSSDLNLDYKQEGKNEDVINLCKLIGADYIYDAKGAESFLDGNVFKESGITIEFQEYVHPKYFQLWGEFEPYMSVIDIIFNHGEKSLEIVKSGAQAINDKPTSVIN